jgi:putative transposase
MLCLLKSPFLLRQLMLQAPMDRLLAMMSVLSSIFQTLPAAARSRIALQLEILALRHQLAVLERTRPRRLRLATMDRWLWVVLSRVWSEWRAALVIVKPETVIAWHRRRFRLWWTWKSRHRMGRPTVPTDVRTLIRTMAEANPRWARRGFMANW